MSRVIFLSDNTSFGRVGAQRYIGPYSVAHSLEAAGIDTVVVDYFNRKENFFEYLKQLLTKDTLVIGISSTFISPAYSNKLWYAVNALTHSTESYSSTPLMFKESAEFRIWLNTLRETMNEICPNAKIIVGGAKVQFLLNYGKEDLCEIDYFLWGAADAIFIDVVNLLKENKAPHFLEINGHKVIDTMNHYKSTKACPEFEWKQKWSVQSGEALPIEISRGCIFNCKFCHYEKKESFKKDLESLRLELIRNYELFNVSYYHFCDDCFNDGRAKVEAVCNMIKSLPFKLEWVSYARVDVAIKFPETARLMVESGCRALHWGIETLNEKVAKQIGKGTPSQLVKNFLNSFYKDYGDLCLSHGSFITGLPGETKDTQIETIDWICDNEALHFITVGPLKLFPYKNSFDGQAMDFSDYSRDPAKYGFKKITFNPSDWEHETMNRQEAYDFATLFNEKWRSSRTYRRGTINTMWNYPHLRSLGYSLEETRKIYFDVNSSGPYAKDLNQRFKNRLNDYFEANLTHNRR